ncbi:MAG: response regulator [Candidatus Gastranaerophilales bacterium]|nr:response regulator [Candidatus Gastranaerophilales bacterium]
MNNSYHESEDTKNIFKIECEEIIRDFAEQIDLYKKTKDIEIITKLMRDAHSIKGAAGIAGYPDIQKTAHEIEDLLAAIKKEQTEPANNIIDDIRHNILNIAEYIKTAGHDKNVFDQEFFNNFLKNINLLKTDISVAAELARKTKNLFENSKDLEVVEISKIIYSVFIKLKTPKDINSNIVNTLSGAVKILKKIIADNNNEAKDELFFVKQRLSIIEQMLSTSAASARKATAPTKAQVQNILPDILKILGQESIKTLRIDTIKLDNLYENVIKLETITKKSRKEYINLYNTALQLASVFYEVEKIANSLHKNSADSNANILKEIQQLGKTIKKAEKQVKDIPSVEQITNREVKNCINEIQTTVKNIRILPVGVILHMFPRMVRDIAKLVNKEISMEIKGSETGVDKKILEEIKTPLIHLLRNAVDHGIELPEVRKKLGKPIFGKITISAKNQGENFIISVSDDGCGINFDKIKAKALKEKLLGNSEIKKLKRQDFLNMLFKPGFSTEEKITELSGRGMGLDIVYTTITSLNGQIKINTQHGKGTEIVMTIPSGYFAESDDDKYQNLKAKNVLLVDDSRTTLIYFSKILTDNGFKVTAKNNAKDALTELKNGKYDLIISDYEMPNMNGFEFVQKIRKYKKYDKLPIIILSMLEKDKLKEIFKDTNISKIISKENCKPQQIINALNKTLNIQ